MFSTKLLKLNYLLYLNDFSHFGCAIMTVTSFTRYQEIDALQLPYSLCAITVLKLLSLVSWV